MIKKIKGISTFKQKDYVKAEVNAYDELVKAGYKPTYDMKIRKAVIFMIENENRNNEKQKIFYFENYQEALDELVIKQIKEKKL